MSVRYIVNDVTEAIAFYRDRLGFSLLMHPAPPLARGAQQSDGSVPTPGGWNRF